MCRLCVCVIESPDDCVQYNMSPISFSDDMQINFKYNTHGSVNIGGTRSIGQRIRNETAATPRRDKYVKRYKCVRIIAIVSS